MEGVVRHCHEHGTPTRFEGIVAMRQLIRCDGPASTLAALWHVSDEPPLAPPLGTGLPRGSRQYLRVVFDRALAETHRIHVRFELPPLELDALPGRLFYRQPTHRLLLRRLICLGIIWRNRSIEQATQAIQFARVDPQLSHGSTVLDLLRAEREARERLQFDPDQD